MLDRGIARQLRPQITQMDTDLIAFRRNLPADNAD